MAFLALISRIACPRSVNITASSRRRLLSALLAATSVSPATCGMTPGFRPMLSLLADLRHNPNTSGIRDAIRDVRARSANSTYRTFDDIALTRTRRLCSRSRYASGLSGVFDEPDLKAISQSRGVTFQCGYGRRMLTDIGLEPCHHRLRRAYPRRHFSLGKASCGSSLQDIIQKLELLRQRIILAPNVGAFKCLCLEAFKTVSHLSPRSCVFAPFQVLFQELLGFLDEVMQHHNSSFDNGAIENPCYAFRCFEPEFKKAVTHRPGMRHSKIGTEQFHAFGVPQKARDQNQQAFAATPSGTLRFRMSRASSRTEYSKYAI